MRKIVIGILVISFMMASQVFAAESTYDTDVTSGRSGWSVYVLDDCINTTAELLTELNSTYLQLPSAQTVEVLSDDENDITQTITIYGINNVGKKAFEDVSMHATNGTLQTNSSTTWRYIDQVEVDAVCAGNITVRQTDNTTVTSVPIGKLEASMAQHFNGEYFTYVTSWRGRSAAITGIVTLELRQYNDDNRCLNDTTDLTGYKVLDSMYLMNTTGTSQTSDFKQPIRIPAGAWLSVYGTGGVNSSVATVTVQGFDSRR